MIAELLLALQVVHPCDAALPVNPNLSGPVVAGFCTDQPSTTARVYVDGQLVWSGTAALKADKSPLSGDYYFESPPLTIAKGTHSAQVDISNGTLPMDPAYQFTITVPGQAKKPRIIK